MKKIIKKIFKRKEDMPQSSRITTDTVAEHREKVLAGGRKFKYPIQYAKHKVVFNAIIIVLGLLMVSVIIGWLQLYKVQNTSEFMYRVTKVLPIPVANVDGQTVLYSDYLMKYLSSVNYLSQKEQVDFSTDDGKRRIVYIKQQSMENAMLDAYATKLAKELDVSVSDSDLEFFLKEQRQTSNGEISEQTYNAVILDYYGWNETEYRHAAKNELLRQKVAYAIDTDAKIEIDSVADKLTANSSADLVKIAKEINLDIQTGNSGWVPKTNQDGGLAAAASNLKEGEVSSIIESTTSDGYYYCIVRLVDIDDSQVKYDYIKVPLTAFSDRIESLELDNKIKQYIDISEE